MVAVTLFLLAFVAGLPACLTKSWLSLNQRSIKATRHFLSIPGVDGCTEDGDVSLCQSLPALGDGVCSAVDLRRILATVQRQGWHGDKAQLIRSESPLGWLPVPALQPSKAKRGPPSNAWQEMHSQGVYMLDGFLSDMEADAIVAQVQTREPISSEVVQPVLPTCGFRRSTSWVFFGSQRQEDPFPHDLLDRMEGATHVSTKHYEPAQVVEYNPGDFFSDHYDTSACDHIGDHKLEELNGVKLRESLPCDDSTRRQGTLIVYLTDESSGTGGATYFPKLGVRVQPKKGRALFFRPTRPDGSTDPYMLHSAETLVKGRKFLLQQWMMHGTGW